MSLSNAEKVRRYRERQKAKRFEALRKAMPLAGDVFRQPFFRYWDEHIDTSDFEIPLDWAGIEIPVFDDDRGPEAYVDPAILRGLDEPFGAAKNSLDRAEIMVGCLIDAATALAKGINKYRIAEIASRLRELEEADLSDPATKKAAFAEIARLNKMQDQLSKQVRWTFPQWKVTD